MFERLYHNRIGRAVLSVFTRPSLSRGLGRFLDSAPSRLLIRPFIFFNRIDLTDTPKAHWPSFNAFFIRALREGARPFEEDPAAFSSPCDSYLSAFPIFEDETFFVKGQRYTLAALLENDDLARAFEGGLCLIFRLTPRHYHHYAFPASGRKGQEVRLPGRLHMVRPEALEKYPVLCSNARAYTPLETDAFGSMVYMEVGAMMVGRICNHHTAPVFSKGEEKGYFEFGGSTVIVLVQKGALSLKDEFPADGQERSVLLGQTLGYARRA